MAKKCCSRNTKNFGFGRKLDYAIKNGLRIHYGDGHFATVQAHRERCRIFCDWLQSNHQISDARHITLEIVQGYAAHVRGIMETGEIAVATATNRISSINVALTILRGDTRMRIGNIGKALGAQRSHIRITPPQGMVFEELEPLISELIQKGFDRIVAIMRLARSSGMRLREAILADLPRLQREALNLGEINVQDGCKGGRCGAYAPRWVPATDRVRSALEFALAASPPGSRNLLSPTETYVGFLRNTVKIARGILKSHGLSGFHELRASYACERYEVLMGVPAPVCVNNETHLELPAAAIQEARQIISHEMGHGRLDVTNAYLGKKR